MSNQQMTSQPIVAYKAFDTNMQCLGYQYEVGETYHHDGSVKLYTSGFHGGQTPLDCLWDYPMVGSRFARVTMSGEIDESGNGSRICAESVTIEAELTLPEFIRRGTECVLAQVPQPKKARKGRDWSARTKTDDHSAVSNTGLESVAANTGARSAATNTGIRSAAANTGIRSAATNSGHQSAAVNTGDQSVATNTGFCSAATNTGDRSIAANTGAQSTATNTGFRSAATNTGERSVAAATCVQSVAINDGKLGAAIATGGGGAARATGTGGIAIAAGPDGRAMGEYGCDLVLREFDDSGNVINRWIGTVGHNGIKPNTWYVLRDGKPTEVA